ncbi:MAG: FG-GAP repeat protein, partial [Actinomycetota bacterium]
DNFGTWVTSGDFDGDGPEDLAVGVPFEDIGAINHAGAVNVIYGGDGGLSTTGNQLFHQDSTGIDGAAETGDRFGDRLAAGDYNGDGEHDLAIGAPFEDLGSVRDAGVVHVLFGSSGGLVSSNDQLWHQDSSAIAGGAEAGDKLGRTAIL